MGNSWRIGIDEEKKTQLVPKGVFGIELVFPSEVGAPLLPKNVMKGLREL